MQKVLDTILQQSATMHGQEATRLIDQSNKILARIRAVATNFECAYLQNNEAAARKLHQEIIDRSNILVQIKDQMLTLRRQSRQFAQVHAIPSVAPGESSHDISQTRNHHLGPIGRTQPQMLGTTTSTHVPAAASVLPIRPLDHTQIRGVLMHVPHHCQYTDEQRLHACTIKQLMDATLNRDLDVQRVFYQALSGTECNPQAIAKIYNPVTIYSPVAFLLEQIRLTARLNARFSFVFGILDALAECSCVRYDRAKAPEMRGKFEKEMLELARQHLNPGNLTTCTFVGAGELFSAVFKISKLLEQGFRHVRINLIDNNVDYVQAVEQMKGMAFESIMGILEQQKDTVEQPGLIHLGSGICAALPRQSGGPRCPYQALQWFAYLLETYYPATTIEVAIYKDMNDYAQDCCEGKNTQADILAIEDLDIPDHTMVILPAFDQLLRTGGIYAILSDTCLGIPYEQALEQAEGLLSRTIPMDDLLGCAQENKGLSYFEHHRSAALTRQYVGIKQF